MKRQQLEKSCLVPRQGLDLGDIIAKRSPSMDQLITR